jgi:hypothetical protein
VSSHKNINKNIKYISFFYLKTLNKRYYGNQTKKKMALGESSLEKGGNTER